MLSKAIVKYIQSLSHKKLRDEEGVFVAEGPKVVDELLRAGMNCKMICGVKDWMNANEELIQRSCTESMEIDDIDLEKISSLKTSNKVVAVFYKKEEQSYSLKNSVSLLLDEIQDPGNLGTIIRIADWFGVATIICSNECADCYNTKVVQSSMGSLARVNVVYENLKEIISSNNIKVYAATLKGKDISSFGKINEGIILIGNESKGVKEELLELVSEKITIPKYGDAESLNAAVACGIILSWVT